MEEQFFLDAVNKALRWAETLRECVEAGDDPNLAGVDLAVLGRFAAQNPEAKFTRDMRQHDDEYLLGEGRRQDEEGKIIAKAGRPTLNVGQGITVVQNERILLGGRVDVQETMDSATPVIEHLLVVQRAWVDGRGMGEGWYGTPELVEP